MSADDYHPFVPKPHEREDRRADGARACPGADQEHPRAQELFGKLGEDAQRAVPRHHHRRRCDPRASSRRGPRARRRCAMIEAVNALLAADVAGADEGLVLSGRFQPMAALAEHRALSSRITGCASTRSRAVRDAVMAVLRASMSEHGYELVARRDEAQPLPRRPRRRPGGAGRMELHLLPVRHAVRDRALGLAVVRPSSGAQLLRARPSRWC